MSEDYSAFLARKALTDPPTGLADIPELPAAIFAQTGLGKSLMELAWGQGIHHATGGDVLLLTPLAVAGQMVREAGKFGLAAKQCACQERSNRASPLPTTPSCITSICRALRA